VNHLSKRSRSGRAALAFAMLAFTALVVACGGESPTPTTPTTTTPLASVTVASLTLRSESVTGGESVEGVVTLTGPAAAAGLTVMLSSDIDAAALPATVAIVGGQSTGTFPIETRAVNADAVATIRASVDGEAKSAELVVKARALPRMVLKLDGSFNGGQTTPGAVELDGPAPEGGMTIRLSSDSSALILPPGVTVPAGARVTTFNVVSREVNDEVRVTVTASAGAQTTSAAVVLRPLSFFRVASSPEDVVTRGRTANYTSNQAAFEGFVCSGWVSFDVTPSSGEGWSVWMIPRKGSTISPGTYQVSPSEPDGPYLTVGYQDRGCAPAQAQFIVTDVTYGSKKGEILRFRATFEQRCSRNGPPLTGEISVFKPKISVGAGGCP
jgi:hypothetical protein